MTTLLTATKRRSALQAFTECQFRWNSIYVEGHDDQSAEALRGSAFHACAERYIRALWQAREPQNHELARVALIEGIAASMCPAHLLEDVEELFWKWAEKFELNVDAYLLNEENPPDPDDYQLRIDLAYAYGDTIEIDDFKTHHAIWSEARIRAAFQPRFYVARARRIWPGFRVYRFVMVFVRFGVSVSVEYTAADLDRVDGHVEAIELAQVEAIAKGGPFPASAGDHCGYCQLRCPLVDEARLDPVRAVTPEEAAAVGGEYLALVQAVKARRDVLNTYTAVHGSIDVGGVTFGHEQTEKKKFPAADVVQTLRDAEIAPVFFVGTTALRAYLKTKKFAHVREDLEALAIREPGSRFTTKRSSVPADDDESAEARGE